MVVAACAGKSGPSIGVSADSVCVAAAGEDGVIEVSYFDFEPNEVLADIQFVSVDGETPAVYPWVTAELDGANDILYVVAPNTTSEPRTAYLKLNAAPATCLITIIQH